MACDRVRKRCYAGIAYACNNIQMMRGCKWNIQICCPEVNMSTQGRSPSRDISTEGQHIWMFHEQPCFICFGVWPTTSKHKIPMNNIFTFLFTQNYRKLSTTKVNIDNVEYSFVYIVGSANFGNNRATLSKHVARCNMSHVARSHAQECNVRLWPISRGRVSANQRSSS